MQTLDWAARHASRMHAQREAVVDGDRRLTFAQLGERCARLGAALQGLGVQPGDRVAVLIANSHRYLELHCAVPGIGAVLVPLNSRLAPAEMAHILADSGATLLVLDAAHAGLASALAREGLRLLTIPGEYERLLAEAPARELPGPDSDEAPAGLYYTGGTTGPAKGVVLTHRNLLATTQQIAIAFEIRPAYTVLNVFPLFHLAAVAGIYALIWQGVKQVFLPTADPGSILGVIARERVTHTSVVPALLNFVLQDPRMASADVSSLMQVTHGGSPIAPDLCRRASEQLRCRLVQGYGMTESAGMATLLFDEQELLAHERIRSAGRAVPGMELVVRRPDGSACATREIGEVTLRGPGVMRGYWNRPEETARVLRDGWLWTGDLGFLDEEHYVFIVDRAKDMVVTGGENVYSVEVEAAIAAHPAVLEVCVVGIPSEQWGEAVHAVVRIRPGAALSEKELLAHCRERIAGYKCPKSVSFATTELPKSGVGKILKRELRAPYWEGRHRSVA